MPLITHERLPDTFERARWRAEDSATGIFVGITVSHEALQDLGQDACLTKAKDKYKGIDTMIDITTGDF